VLLVTVIEMETDTGTGNETAAVTVIERATLIVLLKFTGLTLLTPSLMDHRLRITYATAVEKKVHLESPLLIRDFEPAVQANKIVVDVVCDVLIH